MPSRNGVRDDKGGGHDKKKFPTSLPGIFCSKEELYEKGAYEILGVSPIAF